MKDRRKRLRNDSTKPERILWEHLKGSRLGFKFRRSLSLDYFIADFYCPTAKLIIEVDGDSHFEDGARVYDEQRTDKIAELGILVIRFTNQEVVFDLERILDEVQRICSERTKSPLLSKEG